MSYTPGLTGGEPSMCLLTGAQAVNNASPTAVEPAGTTFISLPPTTTDGMTFNTRGLIRGIFESTKQCMARVGDADVAKQSLYYEQANVRVIRSGTTDLIGGEISDDEFCAVRDASDVLKLVLLAQYSTPPTSSDYSLSFGSTYPRFCSWRMG